MNESVIRHAAIGARACAAMAESSSEVLRTGAENASRAKDAAAAFKGFRYIRIGRRGGVEEKGDPGDMRRDLLQQLQPLASDRWLDIGEAGDIAAAAARSPRSRCPPDRKRSRRRWGCARVLQQRRRGWCVCERMGRASARRVPSRIVASSQVRRRCPANVEADVTALRPPELPQPRAERRDAGLCLRVALDVRHQRPICQIDPAVGASARSGEARRPRLPATQRSPPYHRMTTSPAPAPTG